jgi:alkylated DNA repair protein (DNA oxidative demethylase)
MTAGADRHARVDQQVDDGAPDPAGRSGDEHRSDAGPCQAGLLVRSFGLAQVGGAYDVGPPAPIPAELDWLRERCAGLMVREPEELVDLLVSRYPPGAGIGWHRDAPQFGDVGGISLLTACRMRFRRGRPRAWETGELTLEPRSAYVLSGPAWTQWQHHIPPVAVERWSITFRTLRHPAGGARWADVPPSRVAIVSGNTARHKLVEIEGGLPPPATAASDVT